MLSCTLERGYARGRLSHELSWTLRQPGRGQWLGGAGRKRSCHVFKYKVVMLGLLAYLARARPLTQAEAKALSCQHGSRADREPAC